MVNFDAHLRKKRITNESEREMDAKYVPRLSPFLKKFLSGSHFAFSTLRLDGVGPI